jgi:putative colanic acid biosynthesis acetyltransferase WcaF
VGKGVKIKPKVKIKYPWNLEIGRHCWIGEEVWIDSLSKTVLGDSVCLSQGCMLLCGNHNYKSESFKLITESIVLENGAWIGARSIVTAGVRVGSHAVLLSGSVASSNMEAYTIYRGNPAVAIKKREIAP